MPSSPVPAFHRGAAPPAAARSVDPDAAVVARAVQGDAEAIADLLHRHQARLYNLAFRALNHAEDAADATQEAMLKISRGVSRFRGQSRVSTWMTRIVLHEACNVGRSRARRQSVRSEEPATTSQREQRREPAPEQRLADREAQEAVTAALAEVPEGFRQALLLRDVEKMEYAEIAEVLDVPVGTVRSRIFRGRLALRDVLLSQEAKP